MSQNLIDTVGTCGPARVRAGWDGPLQELYCSVEHLGDSEPDELPPCYYRTVYSTVAEIEAAVVDAGIRLPQAFLAAVNMDRMARTGSVLRMFSTDGALLEERSV